MMDNNIDAETTEPFASVADFLRAMIAHDQNIRIPELRNLAEALRKQNLDRAAAYFTKEADRLVVDYDSKRRIVELLDDRCLRCANGERCITHDSSAGAPSIRYLNPINEVALGLLALPYADRPGYVEVW